VYLFGSPAHHQVHHSYHPAHINKNFAFMFPVWDVMFRTFHVPQTDVDVKFGLSGHPEDEFTSCVELYWVPFRNALATLRQRTRTMRHARMSQGTVALSEEPR
jgi:sterol desaturase/sphingolipid hydroxylase (fatty acid hydroxylase superfamily)